MEEVFRIERFVSQRDPSFRSEFDRFDTAAVDCERAGFLRESALFSV